MAEKSLYVPKTSSSISASTPDKAAFAITDLDFRIKVALNRWTTPITAQRIAGQDAGGGNFGWGLDVNSDGTLRIVWSTDGSSGLTASSQVPVPFANTYPYWLRYVLDVNNGAAGRDAKFYTSPPDDGVNWTQLGGTVTQAGTTSIFNSTTTLGVGRVNGAFVPQGYFYKAVLLNAIDGTEVANPDFSAQALTAVTFTDAAGNLWSLNGRIVDLAHRDVNMETLHNLARANHGTEPLPGVQSLTGLLEELNGICLQRFGKETNACRIELVDLLGGNPNT